MGGNPLYFTLLHEFYQRYTNWNSVPVYRSCSLSIRNRLSFSSNRTKEQRIKKIFKKRYMLYVYVVFSLKTCSFHEKGLCDYHFKL
jgi:hypothetical protein